MIISSDVIELEYSEYEGSKYPLCIDAPLGIAGSEEFIICCISILGKILVNRLTKRLIISWGFNTDVLIPCCVAILYKSLTVYTPGCTG